ncbi:myo-inositol-1-phosphate synthase [Cladorrhinum sp. PSN332]|nr:myo-inositol-1-phosphate synthase [Cladorrhinum sp. PSN332]
MAAHNDMAKNNGVAASTNGTTTAKGFIVNSPNIEYTEDQIRTKYTYHTTDVNTEDEKLLATPRETRYGFVVNRKIPKLGIILDTRKGKQAANYYGSLIIGSTIKLSTDNKTRKDVNIPFHDILPMSMDRASVLEPALKAQVAKEMAAIVPLPSIYYPDFIAANQEDRADNLIDGDKAYTAYVKKIRQDIRDFKAANNLDKGVNDTADYLLKSIEERHTENTFVPGAIELVEKHNTFIGGDDFKSGQTKMNYNHLGNNDGKNLSSQKQFHSKEISKSNVIDDMVKANSVLYVAREYPDHTIMIKYMPTIGNNKRAMDEYYTEIFLGGH